MFKKSPMSLVMLLDCKPLTQTQSHRSEGRKVENAETEALRQYVFGLRFKEAVEICSKVLRILKQPQGLGPSF